MTMEENRLKMFTSLTNWTMNLIYLYFKLI